MNVDELLEERGATHGSFEVNSVVAQNIRGAIRDCEAWADLPAVYREALDHIAGKIGRICSAPKPDDMEPDHFADIGGYARLAENYAVKRRSAVKVVEQAGTMTPGEVAVLEQKLAVKPDVTLPASIEAKLSEQVELEQAARRAKLIEDGIVKPGE